MHPASLPEGRTIGVTPVDAALGAIVECGDLRVIDETTTEAIRRAFLDHLVLVFRGQELTNGDLIAFGRRFGEFQYTRPLPSPLAAEGRVKQGGRFDQYPEITVVSNVVQNGIAAGGLGDGEVIWHTDMSNFDATPKQTMLYALEAPETGGRTGFCNMYLALETLPSGLRARIEGLSLKHDSLIDAAGYVRKEYAEFADADIRQTPGAVHPIIVTHPETHNDCLYLGRRAKAYIVGLDLSESEALLDELWAHVCQPQFEWFHQWKPGDLVMWDNRCTMHRREPFDANARRLLHRVVIKGTKPEHKKAAKLHSRGQVHNSAVTHQGSAPVGR